MIFSAYLFHLRQQLLPPIHRRLEEGKMPCIVAGCIHLIYLSNIKEGRQHPGHFIGHIQPSYAWFILSAEKRERTKPHPQSIQPNGIAKGTSGNYLPKSGRYE